MLQAEAYRKEVLDHGIVQIAGDALTIFGQSEVRKTLAQAERGDRTSRDRRQRFDEDFVFGRVRLGLVGQVQVPEHRVAGPHRDTQKGGHVRVVFGEAHRVLVLGDVIDPHRVRVPDQGTEHSVTDRQMTDALLCVWLHAQMDEILEGVVRPQHAHRRILRVGGLPSEAESGSEELVEISLSCDVGSRLHQIGQCSPFDCGHRRPAYPQKCKVIGAWRPRRYAGGRDHRCVSRPSPITRSFAKGLLPSSTRAMT